MRNLLTAFFILCLLMVAQGCQTVGSVASIGADIAAATGQISLKQAESIKRSAQAAGQAFEEFTPENEYYIGRTITANILNRYKVYENRDATVYVNLIGQTLARASDKPETFNGYHFLILDTDEINAFAAPGGFILVSRGLIRCCRYEDALAAVLAHEVGHVQLGHGMGAIQAGRYTSLGRIVGVELAKNLGDKQLAQAAEVFDGTVGDIMKTLVDTGYQSSQEYAADKAAVTIMQRVGYNPMALKDMLEQMAGRLGPNSGGFGKTHPSPQKRLQNIAPVLQETGTPTIPAVRKTRFDRMMANI
ncbi:MAG: M48 family metallopeptidase [Deltaproteobacteria bacterium]|nr:M48 family metallopeptidase [Deltaproteobacteria bacterium]